MSEKDPTLHDPKVSRLYKELSTETTSDALDERILSEAGPQRPLKSLLGFKPLAWAAMLVLTVGIVFEFSSSDDELAEMPSELNAAVEPLADEIAEPDAMENLCSDEERAETTSWYACIVALREAGLTDVAESELTLLRQSYPEFAVR